MLVERIEALKANGTDINVGSTDVISRQAAIDALEKVAELFPWRIPGNRDSYDRYNEAWNDAIGRAEIEIEKLLSAQPELEPEREKGHWQITDAYPHNVYCSECHARFAQTHWAVWEDGSLPRRFCPNCGANMTGDVESRL